MYLHVLGAVKAARFDHIICISFVSLCRIIKHYATGQDCDILLFFTIRTSLVFRKHAKPMPMEYRNQT